MKTPLFLSVLAATLSLGPAAASANATPPAAASPADPRALDPTRMVDALEGTFGRHAGARRSHAKGVCAAGHFVGTDQGRDLSRATVFSGERIPAVLRFSVGGGNPRASDKARSVRGLAVQLDAPGGARWQMANLSAPVFFVARPEHFAGFIESRRPDPATGRPDPQRVAAFNAAHPDTKPQIDWLAANPVPASYAGARYFSVNAFRFVDAAGRARDVRWSFDPVVAIPGLDDASLAQMPDDFLIDELRRRVADGPVTFRFNVQLAAPGDDTRNATMVWPESRERVHAGDLVVTAVEAGPGGACDAITFVPTVLPEGVKPSDDPLLLARAAPYAVSLSRRLAPAPAAAETPKP